jgi:hypothetical protein
VGAGSGTLFDDVDLDGGEWVDYDEKVGTIQPSGDFNCELKDVHVQRQSYPSVFLRSKASGAGHRVAVAPTNCTLSLELG